ncbi:MAG: hypothetical protein VW268_08330 [Rhodospirillaceae bacterium]
MLNRLTEFIRLYGVAASSAVFGFIVMSVGVGADLPIYALSDMPRPSVLQAVVVPVTAGIVAALVIYPFARAAVALESKCVPTKGPAGRTSG